MSVIFHTRQIYDKCINRLDNFRICTVHDSGNTYNCLECPLRFTGQQGSIVFALDGITKFINHVIVPIFTVIYGSRYEMTHNYTHHKKTG